MSCILLLFFTVNGGHSKSQRVRTFISLNVLAVRDTARVFSTSGEKKKKRASEALVTPITLLPCVSQMGVALVVLLINGTPSVGSIWSSTKHAKTVKTGNTPLQKMFPSFFGVFQ